MKFYVETTIEIEDDRIYDDSIYRAILKAGYKILDFNIDIEEEEEEDYSS